MTNTLTDTAHDLLDEQLTTAYKARNVVGAWDIKVRLTPDRHDGAVAWLDGLTPNGEHTKINHIARYLQPIPENEDGGTYYTRAWGKDYHEFSGLSGNYVIARFTVAMDEIVKYVERDAN